MELLINLINYIPDIFQYIFAFAVLITVVVFVHEMGHYLVGKWCGIGVETFSIGMGNKFGEDMINPEHYGEWHYFL